MLVGVRYRGSIPYQSANAICQLAMLSAFEELCQAHSPIGRSELLSGIPEAPRDLLDLWQGLEPARCRRACDPSGAYREGDRRVPCSGGGRCPMRLASPPLSNAGPPSAKCSAERSVGTRHKMSISSINRSRKASSIGLGANSPPIFGSNFSLTRSSFRHAAVSLAFSTIDLATPIWGAAENRPARARPGRLLREGRDSPLQRVRLLRGAGASIRNTQRYWPAFAPPRWA